MTEETVVVGEEHELKLEKGKEAVDLALPNLSSLYFGLAVLSTVLAQVQKLAPKSKALQKIVDKLAEIEADLGKFLGQ